MLQLIQLQKKRKKTNESNDATHIKYNRHVLLVYLLFKIILMINLYLRIAFSVSFFIMNFGYSPVLVICQNREKFYLPFVLEKY